MEINLAEVTKGYKRFFNTYTVRGKAMVMGSTVGGIWFFLKFKGFLNGRKALKENKEWIKE